MLNKKKKLFVILHRGTHCREKSELSSVFLVPFSESLQPEEEKEVNML